MNCPFSEDANLITSLQDELNKLKEEMVQLKNTPVSAHLGMLYNTTHESKHHLSDSFAFPLCFSSRIAQQSLDNYRIGKRVWDMNRSVSTVLLGLLFRSLLCLFWLLLV